MHVTLETNDILRSNFAYLFILTLSSHWYHNGDDALPSIILAGRGSLVQCSYLFNLVVYFDQILHTCAFLT